MRARWSATASAAVALLLTLGGPARADSTEASCSIAAPGAEPRRDSARPCTFSQRQGFVTVRLADGRVLDFEPTDAEPGYRDGEGRPARREIIETGEGGLAFSTDAESLAVYW